MYGKKLDERDSTNNAVAAQQQHHTKVCREPPPNHEFSYRWFRGPTVEPCAYEGCPRRTSFSPHDWSKFALGGSGCSLQCVSAQSSLYKATFCNSDCFVKAWKTQYTIQSSSSIDGNNGIPQAGRSSTPLRKRTGSYCDDDRSVGSSNSIRSGMSSSNNDVNYIPATPGEISVNGSGGIGGGGGSGFNNTNTMSNINPYSTQSSEDEWIEISRDQLYIPHTEDIGRKLKVEAAAYSIESGELLMHRVVKTDLVLSRTPEPEKRNLVTAKPAGGGGARFRIVTYNILAEIYATQQQYPYADLWALSWDFR
jgi:CCR4-NOT transcription complex subunit 6